MKTWLLIFIGSGLGGVTRYGLSKAIQSIWIATFPLPTLIVNVLACLVLGFVAGKVTQQIGYHQELQFFVLIGFCGGFSTFSTFSHENVKLFETGQYFYLLSYITLSVVLCFFSVFLGLKINHL